MRSDDGETEYQSGWRRDLTVASWEMRLRSQLKSSFRNSTARRAYAPSETRTPVRTPLSDGNASNRGESRRVEHDGECIRFSGAYARTPARA
jgi:hypothetical protein